MSEGIPAAPRLREELRSDNGRGLMNVFLIVSGSALMATAVFDLAWSAFAHGIDTVTPAAIADPQTNALTVGWFVAAAVWLFGLVVSLVRSHSGSLRLWLPPLVTGLAAGSIEGVSWIVAASFAP